MNEGASLLETKSVCIGDQVSANHRTSLEPRATGPRHVYSGGLKHMMDSRTFLSAQGVCMSSTRKSMDAVTRANAHPHPFPAVNPFHPPGALQAETCMVPGISWPCTSVALDFPMTRWPGVAAKCSTTPLYGARTAPGGSHSNGIDASQYTGPPSFCTIEDASPSVFSPRSSGGISKRPPTPLVGRDPKSSTPTFPYRVQPLINHYRTHLPLPYSSASYHASDDEEFYCSTNNTPPSFNKQALCSLVGHTTQEFHGAHARDCHQVPQSPPLASYPHFVRPPQTPPPESLNRSDSIRESLGMSPNLNQIEVSKCGGSTPSSGHKKNFATCMVHYNAFKSEESLGASKKLQHGQGSWKADLDVVSSSTGSPRADSPTVQPKSKIEVKLSSDGQLVFNARQRRTLRRALQRQRKVEIDDGKEFTVDGILSEAESQIVIDVVQTHIGRPLPECTVVPDLVKMLLNLDTGEGDF